MQRRRFTKEFKREAINLKSAQRPLPETWASMPICLGVGSASVMNLAASR